MWFSYFSWFCLNLHSFVPIDVFKASHHVPIYNPIFVSHGCSKDAFEISPINDKQKEPSIWIFFERKVENNNKKKVGKKLEGMLFNSTH